MTNVLELFSLSEARDGESGSGDGLIDDMVCIGTCRGAAACHATERRAIKSKFEQTSNT